MVDFNSIAEELIYEVRNGKTVVFEAFPGFGKTRLAALILSRVDKGLVAVRTHNEIAEVFNFLSGRAVYAYGRPKLCFRLKKFSYRICNSMRVFGRCNTKYTSKDVAWLAACFRKPSEIREYEVKRNVCLYNALKMLAVKSKRVVATYDYVVSNPSVLDNREVLVFDEAHSILNYINEVVVEIDEAFIEQIVGELKKVIETRPLAYAIRSVYRKTKTVHEFISRLERILASTRDGNEFVEILEKIVNAYYNGRYYVRNGTYYFLTNTLPKIARVPNKILMGAFLPPFFILGHRRGRVKTIRIEGDPRIKAVIDTSVTTKYTERSSTLYKELVDKIAEYLRSDTGNLVVFPSHKLMEEVLKHLPASIGNRIIQHKEADAVRDVPKGAMLVDVAGGVLTEGVNLRGLLNVIVVGMPYPEPSPQLNLLSKVYGFDNVYTYIALLRTLQAVGRIRGIGTAYLLDKRFVKYKDSFPKWVEVDTIV